MSYQKIEIKIDEIQIKNNILRTSAFVSGGLGVAHERQVVRGLPTGTKYFSDLGPPCGLNIGLNVNNKAKNCQK